MRLGSFFRSLLMLLLALPVLLVLAAWLQWDSASAQVWQALSETVLPDYLWSSLVLCAWVSVGVVSMGSVSAAAVTLFEFRGRQTLTWALLLPLAMPAYVVAYAYTDFLQFSGPLQQSLRRLYWRLLVCARGERHDQLGHRAGGRRCRRRRRGNRAWGQLGRLGFCGARDQCDPRADRCR
jgi:ABC-type Fe3+ transport system permease subunit